MRGIPAFFHIQTECLTCGKPVSDPLTVEELGRYCSRRCYHSAGLPVRAPLRAA